MLISRRNMMAGALAAPAFIASGRMASAAQTLKISHQFPGGTLEEGDFRDRLCRRFAAELEKRTNGAVVGQVYPNSSLMKTVAQFSAVRKGALDLSLYPISYGGGEYAELNIGLMPGLVSSYTQGAAWKSSPVGQKFSAFLAEKGVVILSWIWQSGGVASRNTTIINPADAKGLKVRGGSPAPTGPAKVLKIGSSTASPKAAEKKENKPVEKKEEKNDEAPKPAAAVDSKAVEKKSSSNAPSKTPSSQSSRPPSANGEEIPTESREADSVIKEQEEQLDESLVQDMYGKEHVNIVFIGHVDAGKSTLGGNILYLTGMVDERTMEKYEKEAREAGRESWYLSWALDTSKEERNKGKTVEVGRARFETEKRRYTILDAPGHKSYVPNMISGAAQADVGVLVISARKGEFETGFDKGGQTREHAVLAKMQGINKLVIVINKMDDPTVAWSKERYTVHLTLS